MSDQAAEQPATVEVPTCVSPGCDRPQGSYGRGLCNPCRRRYARSIEKRETTWQILEKAGKCLPAKSAKRPSAIRKAEAKKKEAEKAGEVETPPHKKELAKFELRHEVLDKIADLIMSKRGLTTIAAYLESEGMLTSTDRSVRFRTAAKWKRKAQRRMIHASGFPLTAHVEYLRKKLTRIIENERGVSVANRIAAIKEYRSIFVPKTVHFENTKTERREVTINVLRQRYGQFVNDICGEDSPPALEAKPLEDAPDAGRNDSVESVPAGAESPGGAMVLEPEASGVLGL